jgi:hypothetical protein
MPPTTIDADPFGIAIFLDCIALVELYVTMQSPPELKKEYDVPVIIAYA